MELKRFEVVFIKHLLNEILKIKAGHKQMLPINQEDGYVAGFVMSNKELKELYSKLKRSHKVKVYEKKNKKI